MKFVMIESPYAGDIKANINYAKACVKHSIDLGEAPFASHLFYPQFLDENIHAERILGIQLGYALGLNADLIAFYVDKGWSPGMHAARIFYRTKGYPITERRICG